MDNIYLPHLVTIEDIYERPLTSGVSVLSQRPAVRDTFDFKAGQFGLYSAFGLGESTFCIASRLRGRATYSAPSGSPGGSRAVLPTSIGDTMGFRGPYGNSFPVDDWKGKDIVFIAEA